MSGRTQGETNERNPAPKAARSVTFSPTYFSSLSGIAASNDDRPWRPSNLTGGRSWNMTSHFQRSDGFEACSHVFAATGRANVSVAMPAYVGLPAIALASSVLMSALLE